MTDTLSSARTIAFTAVQASPVQPVGWNVNAVPPLSMASFTLQFGLPFVFAAIRAAAVNVIVFCVPAIILVPAFRITSIVLVPGAEETVASPISMNGGVGPAAGVSVGPTPEVFVGVLVTGGRPVQAAGTALP